MESSSGGRKNGKEMLWKDNDARMLRVYLCVVTSFSYSSVARFVDGSAQREEGQISHKK